MDEASRRKAKRASFERLQGFVDADESHRLIHERVRLALVSALAVNDRLAFSELRDILGLTDGNLSVHARKLEEGGLIKSTKSFVGRKPKTEYRLTEKGRRVLAAYLDHMERLIRVVRRR